VLATLEGELGLGLALHALQSQHNLLRGLRLLVENGLGLTTITALLTVVSTLTLAVVRGFSLVSGPSFFPSSNVSGLAIASLGWKRERPRIRCTSISTIVRKNGRDGVSREYIREKGGLYQPS
jgi:hypothetical protein